MNYDSGITKTKFIHFYKLEDFLGTCDLLALDFNNNDGYYESDKISIVDKEEFDQIKNDIDFSLYSEEEIVDYTNILEEIEKDIGEFDCLELSYE